MPLNLSFTHMVVIGIVALVVLGPERLPQVARQAGNLYREWKRVAGGLEAEVRDVFADFAEPLREPLDMIRNGVVGDDEDDDEPAAAPAAVGGAAGLPPLTPAIPALGPGSGLVSPGPTLEPVLPELAPPPDPDTFVPFTPGPAAGPAD